MTADPQGGDEYVAALGSAGGPVCSAVPLERLEAVSLTYTYPGSGRGIRGVNLRLERGSFTVVAGASGAGKTTLLRALLGQLPLQAGEIRWNGALVTSAPAVDPGRLFVTPQVAYVAQACATPEEALCWEVAEALEADAELLVLDDLSAVLSARQERALWDALFARRLFRRRGACLAVSHRQAALSRADHILVLAEGMVVGEGRLETLLRTCAEMRRIYGVNPEGAERHPRRHPQGL
jgi:ATP-binding cassette subfamily B protein